MKPKAKLLIVEDKAIIYKRLKMILKAHNYAVDKYTPSVEDAIAHIHKNRPDLVLLDIELQGEHNGVYLGKMLKTQYHIPFIYVTDHEDDQTFYESLQTQHSDFITKKEIRLTDAEAPVIQTKPHLDEKRLIRSIQRVLASQPEKEPFFKEGVMGLVDYLENLREFGSKEISKVPVKYKNIVFFTVKPFQNEDGEFEEVKTNYLWFQTLDGEYYFLKTSLKDLKKSLPYHFVRINESYIVNINSDVLSGRINGSMICIHKKEYTISATYKNEVQKRLDFFYRD